MPTASLGEINSTAVAGEFLPPFSRPRFALAVVSAIVVAMAFFTLAPQIDIAVSAYFEQPGDYGWTGREWACRAFALGCHPILLPIRDLLHGIPFVLAAILLVVTLWRSAKLRSMTERQVLRYAAAFWSFVIGGIVLIDLVLKPSWGRPRPYHMHLELERFKDHVFVPIADWGGACVSNCSFASGEAFALFWVVCATSVLPQRFRRTAFYVALPLAIFGSLLRVSFGAHFLSDVVVAALLAVLMFSICAITAAAIERRWGNTDRPATR